VFSWKVSVAGLKEMIHWRINPPNATEPMQGNSCLRGRPERQLLQLM